MILNDGIYSGFFSDRTDLAVAAPLDRISHGEEIQLVHGITGRNLNSHNVAAPASPTKQVREKCP